MANEIQIHLATYLKDAGIKASQQQIEKLSKQVQKANKQAAQSADELGGSLGNLGGPLGKLQKAIGGFGGTAMSVLAAFKVGWDIGEWLSDKVIRPIFDIGYAIERLKKHNKQVEEQWRQSVAAFNEAMSAWEGAWNKQVDGADRARQAIEDTTAAYLRMQQAKEKVQGAADNAEMLGLRRDKFNAMAGAATPEEAAAAGKYHDVLIAEAQQKQQLAKFDRDAETAAHKQAAAEEALKQATEKRVALRRQLADVENKLAYFRTQASVDNYGFENSVKMEEELAAKQQALRSKWQAADRDVEKRKAERDAVAVEMTADKTARSNLKEKTQLEIDEKRKAYDDYMSYVEKQKADERAQQQADIRKGVELERQERTKMEQELAKQRIADVREAIAAEKTANGDARSRQSAASGKLSQAWGWYRNQQSMQAVIDEKKAQEIAEAQWAKDFSRLQSRRSDWRTVEMGKLSAADESVRQVALAKEEKEAADRAVIETAENTRQLAQKLDELLQVKG